MVLYYCYHQGLFPLVFAHRLTECYEEDAIILTESKIQRLDNFWNRSVSAGIFSAVWHIPRYASLGSKTSEEAEKKIIRLYDKYFEDNTIDLSAFSRIFVIVDVDNDFGVYLCVKMLSHFILSTTNMYFWHRTLYDVMENWIRELPPTWHEYLKLLKNHDLITCKNPLVTPIICYNDTNPFDEDKTVIYFNYKEAISKLSKEHQNSVMIVYGVIDILIPPSPTCLVLFRNITETTNMQNDLLLFTGNYLQTRDSFLFANQVLLDYYLQNDIKYNIVFKPHPTSPIYDDEIRDYYEGETFIPEIYPVDFFQFIPTIKERKFDLLLSPATTALPKTEEYCKSLISVSHGIYTIFYMHHALYVSLSLLCHIKYSMSVTFLFGDKGEYWRSRVHQQITSFMQTIFPQFKFRICFEKIDNIDANQIYIVETCEHGSYIDEVMLDCQHIIFLDFKNNFLTLCENNHTLFDSAVPILIVKKKTKLLVLDHMFNECIVFLSRCDRFIELAKQFKVVKSLRFCGIELSAKHITSYEWCVNSYRTAYQVLERKRRYFKNTEISVLVRGITGGKRLSTFRGRVAAVEVNGVIICKGWHYLAETDVLELEPFFVFQNIDDNTYRYYSIVSRYHREDVRANIGEVALNIDECGIAGAVISSDLPDGKYHIGVAALYKGDLLLDINTNNTFTVQPRFVAIQDNEISK